MVWIYELRGSQVARHSELRGLTDAGKRVKDGQVVRCPHLYNVHDDWGFGQDTATAADGVHGAPIALPSNHRSGECVSLPGMGLVSVQHPAETGHVRLFPTSRGRRYPNTHRQSFNRLHCFMQLSIASVTTCNTIFSQAANWEASMPQVFFSFS